ncbi:hypothetical protein SLA2020_056630 [Shorea laevis]
MAETRAGVLRLERIGDAKLRRPFQKAVEFSLFLLHHRWQVLRSTERRACLVPFPSFWRYKDRTEDGDGRQCRHEAQKIGG